MKKICLLLIAGIINSGLVFGTDSKKNLLTVTEKKNEFNVTGDKASVQGKEEKKEESIFANPNVKRGIFGGALLALLGVACAKYCGSNDNLINKTRVFTTTRGKEYSDFYDAGKKLLGATGILVAAKYVFYTIKDPNDAWTYMVNLFTKNPFQSLAKEDAFKKNSAIYYEMMVKKLEEEKAAKEKTK